MLSFWLVCYFARAEEKLNEKNNMKIEKNNTSYKLIADSAEYVRTCLAAGDRVIKAYKFTPVLARIAMAEEELIVYIENGHEEVREWIYPGDVIAKRTNPDGTAFIDSYGHMNIWKMSPDYFYYRYDIEQLGETEELCYPRKDLLEFLQVKENIAIYFPHGKGRKPVPQSIEAGGYLNITDIDNIYGISESEFYETYKMVES